MDIILILMVIIYFLFVLYWLIFLFYNTLIKVFFCKHIYHIYGTRRDFKYIHSYISYRKYTYYQFLCEKCHSKKEIPSFELIDKYNEIHEQTKIDIYLKKIDTKEYDYFKIKIEGVHYYGYSCFKLWEFYLSKGIDLLEINKI